MVSTPVDIKAVVASRVATPEGYSVVDQVVPPTKMKTKQDKTRQDKTRQDKKRQGKDKACNYPSIRICKLTTSKPSLFLI
jgi:hypothetical protein